MQQTPHPAAWKVAVFEVDHLRSSPVAVRPGDQLPSVADGLWCVGGWVVAEPRGRFVGIGAGGCLADAWRMPGGCDDSARQALKHPTNDVATLHVPLGDELTCQLEGDTHRSRQYGR